MIKNKIVLEFQKSAKRLGVDFEFVYRTYFYLSKDNKRILFSESMPETTDALSYRITENKLMGNIFLKRNNFPVLDCEKLESLGQAKLFLEKNKKIVVKPIGGIHGKGITVGIENEDELEKAIDFAKKYDKKGDVLLEKFFNGNDCRVLVIGKEKVFASKREPAFVVGDGKLTIDDLIDKRNSVLLDRYWVKKDEITIDHIKKMGYELGSVLEKDKKIFLRKTANVKSGGTATDLTGKISKKMQDMAIEISKYMNMDVIGIDFLTQDIEGDDFCILEMNAYPGILLHIYPVKGKPYPVADEIIKSLFKI